MLIICPSLALARRYEKVSPNKALLSFSIMSSSAHQFFSFAVGDHSALIALRSIENWPSRNTMEIDWEFPKGDPRTEKL
jgi:hypothetical protein